MLNTYTSIIFSVRAGLFNLAEAVKCFMHTLVWLGEIRISILQVGAGIKEN